MRFAAASLALLTITCAGARPGSSASPAESWNGDVAILIGELEANHPNPWHAVEKRRFLEVLGRPVSAGLDSDALREARAAALAEALALLGEGHTHLDVETAFTRSLPLRLIHFGDGFYVVAAVGPKGEPVVGGDLVGGRVTRLGSIEVDEAVRRLSRYSAVENPEAALDSLTRLLPRAGLLRDAGILPVGARGLAVEVEREGKRMARELPFVRLDPQQELAFDGYFKRHNVTRPETSRRTNEKYWFKYLPEQSTVFVQYNQCSERGTRPFADFAKELFALVEKERPARMVVDLRENQGGNSGLFTREFVPRLRQTYLREPGHLVVLIGPHTFSSGVWAVVELSRVARPFFIGEPTGQGANHYGMVRHVVLPSSGLPVDFSTRLWTLVEGDTSNAVRPDLELRAEAAAFFAGRDPVAEAALALPVERLKK